MHTLVFTALQQNTKSSLVYCLQALIFINSFINLHFYSFIRFDRGHVQAPSYAQADPTLRNYDVQNIMEI